MFLTSQFRESAEAIFRWRSFHCASLEEDGTKCTKKTNALPEKIFCEGSVFLVVNYYFYK